MAKVEDAPATKQVAELHSGDRMSQAEFHRICKLVPDGRHAELVGGIVFMSPMPPPQHETVRADLNTIFTAYADATPGVTFSESTSITLGKSDVPRPDGILRISPTQHQILDAPELIFEVAHNGRSIDFHRKRDRYATGGVTEYVVVNLHDKHVSWFHLRSHQEFTADAGGLFRSRLFPGLWLNSIALLAGDMASLAAAAKEGLAAPEHAAFLQQLGRTSEAAQSTRT